MFSNYMIIAKLATDCENMEAQLDQARKAIKNAGEQIAEMTDQLSKMDGIKAENAALMAENEQLHKELAQEDVVQCGCGCEVDEYYEEIEHAEKASIADQD